MTSLNGLHIWDIIREKGIGWEKGSCRLDKWRYIDVEISISSRRKPSNPSKDSSENFTGFSSIFFWLHHLRTPQIRFN